MVAQKLEAAGCWRRASARWLFVMGNVECTEAQREWLLRIFMKGDHSITS
ncbi:PerC family transcriptional regulator, partial [Escherichia coli]